MQMIIIWLCIMVVCIILEMISLGLTTIWFAGGALAAGITAIFTDSIPIQVIVFVLVSVILLFTTRPIAKKHLNKKVEKTNVEGMVGKKVLVTSDIDNLKSSGQVKVNDLEWSARSVDNQPIEVGTLVEIVEVTGVKLIVKKVD